MPNTSELKTCHQFPELLLKSLPQQTEYLLERIKWLRKFLTDRVIVKTIHKFVFKGPPIYSLNSPDSNILRIVDPFIRIQDLLLVNKIKKNAKLRRIVLKNCA